MIVEKIINWIVPFVCGGVVGGLTFWFIFLKSMRDGIQCLLRAEIIRQNEKWANEGFCPIYAKQALSRVYTAYHALKGNDVATGLYQSTIALPDRKV